MKLLIARIAAFAVAVPTLAVMMRPDRWGPHHLFFVPDLVLVAALMVAAILPSRPARPALALAFAFAGGVITTASFSYVARGAASEGWLTMATAAVCVAGALILGFGRTPTRGREESASCAVDRAGS